MLLAARQSYTSPLPMTGDYQRIGWIGLPSIIRREPDVAVVGLIDRGILIAFRGTREPGNERDDNVIATFFDWLNDAACIPTHPPFYPGQVHFGFARSVEALWSQVMGKVRTLLDEGAPPTMFVTGHSKGGALAALAAWRLSKEIDPAPTIRLVTFASARPGGDLFRQAIEGEPAITATRFEVKLDIVPDLPPGPDSSPVALSLLDRLPFRTGRRPLYWPVGKEVRGGPDIGNAVMRWVNGLVGVFTRRAALKSLIPSGMIDAHRIGVPSAYDDLVCGTEVSCDHG
jgi:hypothetical protein